MKTTLMANLVQNTAFYLTYREVLKIIKFPVYPFPSEDFYIRDGLILYNELVVDDRNQKGKTLGQRRLQTPHKTKVLRTAYQEFLDLVHQNPPLMIDNRGTIFKYEKTVTTHVRSYLIKKEESQGTHTRLWLHGVNFAFIIPQPATGQLWAQVLLFDNCPWLLFGLSEDKQKEFSRKI